MPLFLFRKAIVASKYIIMVCFSITGAVVGMIFSIGSGILLEDVVIFEALVTVGLILSIALIGGSVVLPIIYKFGVEKSRLIITLCALLPTGIIILLAQIFKDLGKPVISEDLIICIFFSIPVIAMVISFFVSKKIYMKKEF